jgi:hypothetical protein
MAKKEFFVSEDGIAKLREELADLSNVQRKKIAAALKEAKEFGDLSENASWDDAKDRQAFIEGRISEIEHILRTRLRLVRVREISFRSDRPYMWSSKKALSSSRSLDRLRLTLKKARSRTKALSVAPLLVRSLETKSKSKSQRELLPTKSRKLARTVVLDSGNTRQDTAGIFCL